MAKVKMGIDPTARNSVQGKAITPEQIAASGSEHAHQAAVFQWVALSGRNRWPELDMLFAIPNGGDRRPSVAAAMRAEGVKPGVPDLCLPIARSHFAGNYSSHSLWIELKVPGRETHRNGGRSDEQVLWHQRLGKQGHKVLLTFGWQAACLGLHLYLRDGIVGVPDSDGVTWITPRSLPPNLGDAS